MLSVDRQPVESEFGKVFSRFRRWAGRARFRPMVLPLAVAVLRDLLSPGVPSVVLGLCAVFAVDTSNVSYPERSSLPELNRADTVG